MSAYSGNTKETEREAKYMHLMDIQKHQRERERDRKDICV